MIDRSTPNLPSCLTALPLWPGMRATFLSLWLAGTAMATDLTGRLTDADSGEPIGWAVLVLEEAERHAHADDDGRFTIRHVPPGQYTLQAMRVGYTPGRWTIQVDGDTLALQMRSSAITTQTTVVEGERDDRSAMETPVQSISGRQLRQNLSRTIAETIALEPGLAQRSMGPAPARPVLRGLSGDRLLVLEDGGRTGDLSATSSDHAVAIEPLTTERIEIVRGPEALLFGGNTLGGVVNVVRGAVPADAVEQARGSIAWQAESVNTGGGAGFDLYAPAGPLTVRVDGSLRDADDIATPLGGLSNTALQTANTAIGVSWIRPNGYIGVAYSLYDSDYGIPPDPNGGHPSGVNVRLDRRHREARAEWRPGGILQRLEVTYSHNRFFQEEFESSGALGLEFGVLQTTLESTARLAPIGPVRNLTLGAWGSRRDYNLGGLIFAPSSEQRAGALYVYGEHERAGWSSNASLRFDAVQLRPDEEVMSPTAGHIRTRTFHGLSGGLSTQRQIIEHLGISLSAIRSFRSPQVEEAFAEGPHLAAYSYEVGNADLGSEQALGLEAAAEWLAPGRQLRLAAFRNDISDYIFPRNTGQYSLRRGDLLQYQFVGQDVLMWGFEGLWRWSWTPRWTSDGTVSFTRGRLDSGDDLPYMPPLQGRLGVRLAARDNVNVGVATRFAAAQDRAGEFESTTDGYAVLDLSAEWHGVALGILHTLTFGIDNLMDSEYRRHLNRVREVMPEPGRNLRLLHKLYF
jgi:iron complex outermembrane receptor protein